MDITSISVSRYQTFEQCAQLYKYKYHLKTPSPEQEPFYFVYGKIVHKIAELYVDSKGEKKLGDICGDILSGKIPVDVSKDGKEVIAPPLPAEYKKRVPLHLRSIQKLTDQIGFEGKTEWEFKYDLEAPTNRCVNGVIDRLVQKGDKFFILDYKTTKPGNFRKNRATISEDIQLKTYAKVVQRTFGAKAENIKGALYYLEDAVLVSTGFTQDGLDKVEADLLEKYKVIELLPPEKVWGTSGWWCKRCDYHTLCPFYNKH